MKQDLHTGLLDSRAVEALLETRINVIVEGFDLTADELSIKSYTNRRATDARRLVLALCLRVAGVDRSELADRFNLRGSSFSPLIRRFEGDLAVDAQLRKRVEKICAQLNLSIPGSFEESAWPAQRVAGIWDSVGGYVGVHGEPLRILTRELYPWRELAADICLRQPEITFRSFADRCEVDRTWAILARDRMPGRLVKDPRLRNADREVSAHFGVAPRKESRES